MTFLSIFKSLDDPVFVVDVDGRTLETNAAFKRVFGHATEPGSIFTRWPELKAVWRTALGAITHERTLRIDVRASIATGKQAVLEVRLFSFSHSGDEVVSGQDTDRPPARLSGAATVGVAGVCRDVTLERERTRQLELQATMDDLTGVFSHNQLGVLLDLEIRSAVRRKSTGCFLYFDIDGFKQLNDSAGHAEGDRLLKKVAALLVQNLRAADVVARLGGDEFGVILVDADFENGLAKARRLVELLNGGNANGEAAADTATAAGDAAGSNGRVAVSVGVALFPDHGAGAAEIIRRADTAMYRAKRNASSNTEGWRSDQPE